MTGTIVDEAGRPLRGVAVTVATGIYSLIPSEPVETDEQGHYTAHFGPLFHMADGVSLQAAVVHASKTGYYEKDLCRAGNLGMAFKRPEGPRIEQFVAIVYPGHPYRLDFTMLPAARVQGQLVDPANTPLSGIPVSLEGETYPATNILASDKTDGQGRFRFESVPLLPYRFAIGSGRAAIRSDPEPFREAGARQIILVYRALDAELDCKPAPDGR